MKTTQFLTFFIYLFYISHQGNIKIFLKMFINKYSKNTRKLNTLKFSFTLENELVLLG